MLNLLVLWLLLAAMMVRYFGDDHIRSPLQALEGALLVGASEALIIATARVL